MIGLNDNHRRTILVTFRVLEATFARIRRLIVESRAASPLNDQTNDVTPSQEALVEQCAKRMHVAMLGILRRLEIEPPPPHISTLWAIRTELEAASDEVVEELLPQYLRGGGPVPPEAAGELRIIVRQLQDILNETDRRLA